MQHNTSRKFESGFVGVKIPKSNSIMLKKLNGSSLGVWIAHGEGRFTFPQNNSNTDMQIALQYAYDSYPANPNGSPNGIAGVCSKDGRHLAMMPHPERCLRPWNWAYYPTNRKDKDQVTPWVEMFIAAKEWCQQHTVKKK